MYLELYLNGTVTIGWIARTVRVSPATVTNRLHDAGIPIRQTHWRKWRRKAS